MSRADEVLEAHLRLDQMRAMLDSRQSPHTGDIDSCPHCQAERSAERVASTGQMQW